MRRTQLYLDEALLKDLRARAREQGITVSELVRQSLKFLYPIPAAERRKALQAVVGIWRDRTDLPDTEAYVRTLRRSTREQRLRR